MLGLMKPLREPPIDSRPLAGHAVVLTRAAAQAVELAQALEALGALVGVFPAIKTTPSGDKQLDDTIHRLASFDWLAFTSANGVHYFVARAGQLGVTLADSVPRIACVGTATAEAVKASGLEVALVASEQRGTGLAAALIQQGVGGKRVLLPRSDLADSQPVNMLHNAGAEACAVEAYTTATDTVGLTGLPDFLEKHPASCLVFASGSAARAVHEVFGKGTDRLLKRAAIVTIGPVTAQTCRELGLVVAAEARTPGLEDVVQCIVTVLKP